jgi:hypothetical protein
MQDEMEHPIGAVLEWIGEELPQSNFLDPGKARREIRMANWTLPVLRWQARRYARHLARTQAKSTASRAADARPKPDPLPGPTP